MSLALKIASKQRTRNPIDFAVMPLEGLWWVDAGDFEFQLTSRWRWTLMVMQPKHITETMFGRALETLKDEVGSPGRRQDALRPVP